MIGHGQTGLELATHTSSEDTGLGTALAATEQVYLAPEVFSTESSSLDVFSLGALAFLLLAGRAT
ncbi:MAG: hypothetical protein ACRD2C_14240 [Acidimicrobiales bacterium]